MFLSFIDITWIFLACQLASFSCVLAFAALQGVPLVVLFSEITKKASFMCVCYIIMLVRILKLKKLRTSPGPSFGDCCAELSPEPQPVLWCLHLTLLSLLRSPLSFPPFQLLSLESPLSFPVSFLLSPLCFSLSLPLCLYTCLLPQIDSA